MKKLLTIAAVLAGGYLLLQSPQPQKTPEPKKPVPTPVKPTPTPQPAPKPQPRPSPWPGRSTSVGVIKQGGHVSPNTGEEIQVDFPDLLWFENIGSKIDGAGMCVSSALQQAFTYLDRMEFDGYRDYWAAKERGGSWPENTARHMKLWGEMKGFAPQWINYEGTDTELLELALLTGRPIATTYDGRDNIHYRSHIEHMVVTLHCKRDSDGGKGEWAFMDNNVSNKPLWMSYAEGKERWIGQGGRGRKGWAIIPLYSPPPLPPSNRAHAESQVVAELPAGYQWLPHPGEVGSAIYLYQNGVQVGGWDTFRRVWMPFDPVARTWGREYSEPPVRRPNLFGVDRSKFSSQERITYGDQEITREQAKELILRDAYPGGQLVDDRKKPHLTVIGPAAETKAVLDQIAADADLKILADKCHTNVYEPGHWAVKDCGFVGTGKPTIYVQRGKQVVYRRDGFDRSSLLYALRKADPEYDPSKDPSGNPLLPFSLPDIPLSQDTLILIGGVVLVLFLLRK